MNQNVLAKRLKDLRKANNYTQEFVASYLNIIRQSYSHYETGRNTPNIEVLYKLATLYSIPPDELLQFALTENNSVYTNAPATTPTVNELSSFLNYVNDSENEKKLKHLSKKEKELLYYFEMLTLRDQEDILEFIKIKAKK